MNKTALIVLLEDTRVLIARQAQGQEIHASGIRKSPWYDEDCLLNCEYACWRYMTNKTNDNLNFKRQSLS
jgi:hypothetical protein